MKNVLLDANFPRDSLGATYHVGTKPGEVANRIITVGDHTRAHRIAKHFDGGKPIFTHESQRKFLTLTGLFKGVPITVIAIGMGFSLVDFFVREVRAIVSGDLIIVRMGSCGSLSDNSPIGSLVVPKTSYGIWRNCDYFHPEITAEMRSKGEIEPYIITRPLDCDGEVHDQLLKSLESSMPEVKKDLFGGNKVRAIGDITNASADSFYSSQGRISSHFLDANANLIEVLQERRPNTSTLEMETYLLNHLALCASQLIESDPNVVEKGRIRTGAVQMIFANRTTSAFITPEEVEVLEDWGGKAVCDALATIEIDEEKLHPEGVWSTDK